MKLFSQDIDTDGEVLYHKGISSPNAAHSQVLLLYLRWG